MTRLLVSLIFVISVLTNTPSAAHPLAQEGEARALFVRAELLRRTDACEPFTGIDPERTYERKPWTALPGLRGFPQLRPLLPALAELEGYDETKARRFLACLGQWREAAVLERELLTNYPRTEIAADRVARSPVLLPADIDALLRWANRQTPYEIRPD